MNQIAKFFVKNAKFTIVLTGFVVIMGVFGLVRIKSESYPSVNFAMATVTTFYPGATADDVEAKVTIPLEEEIRQVSGLKDVRSVSQAGFSSIFIRVDMDNEDEVEVLTEIEKAIDRVTNLPSDLRDPPEFEEINSEEFPAVEIALIGKNDDLSRDRLAKLMQEDIEDLSAVKNVRMENYTDPELLVEVDQKKLDKAYINIRELVSQVAARNNNAPGGDIETDGIRQIIKVDGKTKDPKDLEEIVIRSNFNGQQVKLKDLAKAKIYYENRTTLAGYNGEDATILIVNKKAGADTLELVEQLDLKLKKYDNLEDHKYVVYKDEAIKVRNKLDVLSSNALTGLALVIVFLFIFLPGWIGVMASLSLPIAIMGTIGLMPVLGMNLDTITTLALIIALGMLVDNAVVISENFTRLRREGMSSEEAALDSVRTLWFPITATAMTTIAAFLPMLVTKGIMGQFIKWIPVIVTISLLMSLAESFFLLPMRLKAVGFAAKEDKEDQKSGDWFDRFQGIFEVVMEKLVKMRYLVLAVFIGILTISFIFMFKFNKFILFPAEQTEIYTARYELSQNTRVEKTHQVARELSRKVKEVLGDDAEHITFRAGISQTGPNDPKGKTKESVGILLIYVTKQASFDLFYLDALEKLRKIEHPELTSLEFQEQVNGPPVGDAVNATFRSSNKEQLEAVINQVKETLTSTNGIIDVKDDTVYGPDETRINFDYEKMSKLNLDVNNIALTVKAAFQGDVASTVVVRDEEVPIRIKYDDKSKSLKENLANLNILDKRGNLIPLKSIASLEDTQGGKDLKRFDFKRSVTITANVNQDIITSVKANKILRDKFNQLKNEFPEVSIVFGGQAESTSESLESLAQAGVLAIICIYAILVLVFDSFLRPMLIISTIPLGLLGFSVAFYFHDRPISFMALIGIIGLAGIIVNSGIVLISFIDELREKGGMELNEILSKASGMRLRAVLVTSLTTISGLFPTAYGIGGSEAMLIPMTLAMAWGLTSGTFLTLVWVPCGYAIIEDFVELFKSLFIKVIGKRS